MNKAKILVGLAMSLCALAVIVAPASAWFESTNGTPKGPSTGKGVILKVAPASGEVECNADHDTWTIQAITKQEATKIGGHQQLEARFEGKPKAATTTGNCDVRVGGATLEGTVSKNANLQVEQPVKGVTTGLKGKLENNVSIIIVGGSCTINIFSKSNQNIGKVSVTKSGLKNIKLTPELNETVTSETVGAGCELAGLKGGKLGSLTLGATGEILEEESILV
jgi:hypothetical protein